MCSTPVARRPRRSAQVLVRVGSGPAVAAQPAGDSAWSVPVSIDTSGAGTVTVTVVRNGIADAAHTYTWTVRGGATSRPVVVSDAPIGTWLRGAALAVAVAVLLAAAWTVAVARRTRRKVTGDGATADAREPVTPAPSSGLVNA